METALAHKQLGLFDEPPLSEDGEQHQLTPAELWDAEALRALDELFHLAGKYRSGKSYRDLID